MISLYLVLVRRNPHYIKVENNMIVDNHVLIQSLRKELPIELLETDCDDTIREKLYSYINHLINNDFEKLVLILYRIDVHEEKLKKLLTESPSLDAAVVIGNLILNRQLQKIQSRKAFAQQTDNTISEDEKW